MAAFQAIVRGRVQGVGFRYTSLRMAGRSEITGFVRNLPDGSVEMVAQGLEGEINNCLRDIQQDFAGYIRDLTMQEIPHNANHMDFRISY